MRVETLASVRPVGRIAGLDAWRAALMLAGIFVHGFYGLAPTALFTTVTDVSLAFRMGSFFAISGFLGAIALERRGAMPWLTGRLRQLGVPACAGLLVLAPFVWWSVMTSRQPIHGDAPLPFEWHHLWFLFGLMLYSVIAAAWQQHDRDSARLRRLIGPHPRVRLTFLIVATVALAAMAIVPSAMRPILPQRYVHAFANIQFIAGYLPMFVFGFVLARHDALLASVVRAWRLALGIVVACAIAYALGRLLLPAEHAVAQYVRAIVASLCPPAAFALILRSALSIHRVPALLTRLSGASYTIYLLHFPIAVFINTRLAIVGRPHLSYAICVLIAGSASFAIHQLIVERHRWIAFVVNGKWPERAVVAPFASVLIPATIRRWRR